jgi:hypothetical protein
MAIRNLAFATAPATLRRQQRIFRCWYFCQDCNGEWNDELLTAGPSWCPACDGAAEPYCIEEFEEDRAEWED